jgi:AraC-like DNA-binding protein
LNPNADVTKLWDSGIAGLELFRGRLVHHVYAKHIHETYTIGLNDGGLGHFIYRGETRCAYPHSLNLINPGEVHTGQAATYEGWSYRSLYLSVPLMEQVLSQLDWQHRGFPHFLEPVVANTPLHNCFHRLFQALYTPTAQLEQQSLLLTAISHLLMSYGESRYPQRPLHTETKAIAQVRDYLETHYADNVSIDALGELVGLSPYYLIRSFHHQVGLPPHSYQRHCQLLHAKRALRTSLPLADIALAHGFYDQSHLTRHFKRVFGVTPSQYRRSNSVQD